MYLMFHLGVSGLVGMAIPHRRLLSSCQTSQGLVCQVWQWTHGAGPPQRLTLRGQESRKLRSHRGHARGLFGMPRPIMP